MSQEEKETERSQEHGSEILLLYLLMTLWQKGVKEISLHSLSSLYLMLVLLMEKNGVTGFIHSASVIYAVLDKPEIARIVTIAGEMAQFVFEPKLLTPDRKLMVHLARVHALKRDEMDRMLGPTQSVIKRYLRR